MEDERLRELFAGPAYLAASLFAEVAQLVSLAEKPARDDLFAAIWQLAKRLSAPGGALLLLEDIHWAETDSLQLLSYLMEEKADLDVWLVATYRSDEMHRRHPLMQLLTSLARSRLGEEIALEPLD